MESPQGKGDFYLQLCYVNKTQKSALVRKLLTYSLTCVGLSIVTTDDNPASAICDVALKTKLWTTLSISDRKIEDTD